LSRQEASHSSNEAAPQSLLTQSVLQQARQEVLDLHVADALEEYMIQLIMQTRANHTQTGVVQHLQYGASPRATIALDRCARAHAWLAGRDFVSPEDIQSVAFDVLRHRLLLNYEAEASGLTTDDAIRQLIIQVAVP
ncbi:MAG: MoxR family ATPase, partial [Ghiorsea sp.]